MKQMKYSTDYQYIRKDVDSIYEPAKLYISTFEESKKAISSHKFIFHLPFSISVDELIERMFEKDEPRHPKHILLVSDYGYGKTKTLKYIKTRKKENEKEILRKFYLDFQQIDTTKYDYRMNFWNFIANETREPTPIELNNSENTLFLIDHIDQLVAGKKTILKKFIEGLSTAKAAWILACRRSTLKYLHLEKSSGIKVCEILPFDSKQQRNLIKTLLEVHNIKCTPNLEIHLGQVDKLQKCIPAFLHPEEAHNPAFLRIFVEDILIEMSEHPSRFSQKYHLDESELIRFYERIIFGNSAKNDADTKDFNSEVEAIIKKELERIAECSVDSSFSLKEIVMNCRKNIDNENLKRLVDKIRHEIEDGRLSDFLVMDGDCFIFKSKSISLFLRAMYVSQILVEKSSEVFPEFIDCLYPSRKETSFNDAFFYQRLLVANIVSMTSSPDKSDSLRNIYSRFIDLIKSKNRESMSEDDYTVVQVCFEYIFLLLRHLRTNILSSFQELRVRTVKEMLELFKIPFSSPFVQWNALWILRLSFSLDEPKYKEMQIQEIILSKLDEISFNDYTSNEETEIYFSALLFLIKHIKINDSRILENIVDKLRVFAENNLLSGFILYAYLIHGPEKFGQVIEPLLCCLDEEPKSSLDSFYFPLHNVASRAIQTIGAFGIGRDIDLLIDHGFIYSDNTREINEKFNRNFGFIQVISHYAINEILYHRTEIKFDPLSIFPSLAPITFLLSNEMESIFDEYNHCINLYSKIYERLYNRFYRESQPKLRVEEEHKNRLLLRKVGMILSAISKQYFKDKRFSKKQGELAISLKKLRNELKNLHEIPNYMIEHEVASENKQTLCFERSTVDNMRAIVRPFFEKSPDDLIELSRISFERWSEQGKLGNPQIPIFSLIIKKRYINEIKNRHVIQANLDIVDYLMTNELIPSEKDRKITVLDIGSGLGNTTEAILECYAPEKEKEIYCVEFVESLCKSLSIRIHNIIMLKYLFEHLSPESVRFTVHCFWTSIDEFLESFKRNSGVIYYRNKDEIKTIAMNELRKKIKKGKDNVIVYNNDLIEYLKKLPLEEKYSKHPNMALQEHEGPHSYSLCIELQRIYGNHFFTYLPDKNSRDSVSLNKFDLIVANYVLHHLTKKSRLRIYNLLLKISNSNSILAIADPNQGISEINRRYFNFTDEGVFSWLYSINECLDEVMDPEVQYIDENGNGFRWKEINRQEGDSGFHVIFKKVCSTDFRLERDIKRKNGNNKF